MRTRLAQLITAMAALAVLTGPVIAQEPAEETEAFDELEALDELEVVVIVGGFATPRMWKVSRGDHVMWVLGNSGSAPAGVKWRSEQLEARVAQSKVVMYPGWVNTGPDIGVLKAITLLPAAFKAAKNPDGKKLKAVLPPETYARWRVLKTTYIGRDEDVEKWRPAIAIGMLESAVTKKLRPAPASSGKPPPMGPSLRSVVDKAAKKHKVKVRTMPTVERRIKVNAREILKSAYHTDFGDVMCFTQQLEYLERFIEYVNQMVSAPAQGSTRPPRGQTCDQFLINGLRSGEIPDPAGALKVLEDMELQGKLGRQQLDAEWIAAAQAALAKNKSTFAVLSMREVTRPDGYLTRLRELGYEVEEPEIPAN
jgi:hypothetical protein